MSYIELLNSFWESVERNPLYSGHAALYLYLLYECNERFWENPMQLTARRIMLTLPVTYKQISAARNELKRRGLIDFVKTTTNGPVTYYLRQAPVSAPELIKLFDVSSLPPEEEVIGSRKGGKKGSIGKGKVAPPAGTTPESRPRPKVAAVKSPAPESTIYDAGKGYEKFIADFFDETRIEAIEVQCMSLHLSREEYRKVAEEVIAEWIITCQEHKSYSDAAGHLINSIRFKTLSRQAEKEKHEENERLRANRRGTDADSKKVKDWTATF